MIRCINSPFTDIYFHLAAEEYLLKEGSDDVFMLWQGSPAVVMGKHQRLQAEVDREWAEERGIHIARRFTGGGTVYHDGGNINLTFIESVSRLPDFAVYLYRTLEFLSSMGLTAEGDDRLGIYWKGLKVSGSAQCVHRNRVLYHCTLLYDTDLGVLNRVIIPKERIDGERPSGYAVPSVRSEVTNVKACLSSQLAALEMGESDSLSVQHFREAAFLYFSRGKNVNSFSECELEAVYRLKEEKYAQQHWILGR